MEEVELGRGHCPLGGNRGHCCLRRGLGQEALAVGRAPQGLLEVGKPVELRVVPGEGSQDPH